MLLVCSCVMKNIAHKPSTLMSVMQPSACLHRGGALLPQLCGCTSSWKSLWIHSGDFQHADCQGRHGSCHGCNQTVHTLGNLPCQQPVTCSGLAYPCTPWAVCHALLCPASISKMMRASVGFGKAGQDAVSQKACHDVKQLVRARFHTGHSSKQVSMADPVTIWYQGGHYFR